MKLPTAYPTYRSSGAPRLGDVPEHWDVRRLRTVAEMRVSNVDKHTTEGELPVRLCNYVDVYKNDRITQAMPFMSATASQDEIERFRLERDDVLITKDSEAWDDIGVPSLVTESADDLLSGYHLALLRSFKDILGSYLARALQSKAVAYQFHVRANGVTRYGLTHTGIQSVQIPLPPLPEQAAIVRYLDHVDRRIRRYVSAKRKLIALLEEEKQAIINRAVTCGLDPNARLKPSSVEWLGHVPAHWEIRRLGHLATKFGSGITPRGGATVYQEYGVPFLRSQNIHFDGIRIRGVARITPSLHRELSGSHVKPGDVLLNITGASIGRACSVPDDFAEGNVNQHVCIIRPYQGHLLPRLLAAYLSTPIMQREIQFEQSGASREGLTLQSIRNFRVIVPPLPEQRAIVEYLDKATGDIGTAIERTRRQIELVQEYRTRLIADVVTGKLDVREAAAQLLDEAADRDPIEESGPLADGTDEDLYDAEDSVDELAIEREVTV